MSIDYPQYLNRMIVEIADQQNPNKISAVNLRRIHEEIFPDSPTTWLESLATTLHSQGLGHDWQDTDNESFRPNGTLFLRASEIRKSEKVQSKRFKFQPDWTKWGTILTGISIIVAVILAVSI